MSQDIFLRVHMPQPQRARARTPRGPKWPPHVLLFDTETTTDTQQVLKLGVFQIGQLVGDRYVCAEEGAFYDDNANARERQILNEYVNREDAHVGIKAFPPKVTLSVYSRSAFVERVLWKAIKRSHSTRTHFHLSTLTSSPIATVCSWFCTSSGICSKSRERTMPTSESSTAK